MRKLQLFKIVFVLALATSLHAQTFKVLYSFSNQSGEPTGPARMQTIAQSHGGYLVTTTDNNSTDGLGTAFRITTRGQLTVLHRFSAPDGTSPAGGLTLATDGNFYGANYSGGAYGHGTIFKMTPQGSVTTLYSFTGGTDGDSPTSAPIQSMGGDLYGTTNGDATLGSVYKLTRSGQFTLLHTFSGPDGANPFASLLQANDGYFYGTTLFGGAYGDGTIFRISAAGNFTVLFNFDRGAKGARPAAPLIQASDGNLYGVTIKGGTYDAGVVFKMTPDHKITRLHSFSGGADGASSQAALLEASDGNLYGTSQIGGTSSGGVLYRITPSGTFTVLHNFDYASGGFPDSALLQHTNGILYGMTLFGGTVGAGYGTFYSFDLGLQPFVAFLPVGGRAGATVQLLGQDFTGTTAVSFNGVPAQFHVSYSTYMTAVVPAGASTGFITVTTPNGTLKSKKKFLVWP